MNVAKALPSFISAYLGVSPSPVASSILGDTAVTIIQSRTTQEFCLKKWMAPLFPGSVGKISRTPRLGQMPTHGPDHRVLGTVSREQKTTVSQGAFFQEPSLLDFFRMLIDVFSMPPLVRTELWAAFNLGQSQLNRRAKHMAGSAPGLKEREYSGWVVSGSARDSWKYKSLERTVGLQYVWQGAVKA